MAEARDTLPISELQRDAEAVVERVRSSNAPLMISQRGRTSVVMMSAEAYAKAAEERGILEALLRGERDIQAGGGVDLESAFRDADELLDQE